MPAPNCRATALRSFLEMFEEPGACFFLGAGASSPIVPMAAQLGEHALQQVLALGHYDAIRVPLDPVAERIVAHAKQRLRRAAGANGDQQLLVELTDHLSGSAIQTAAIGLLRPDPPERCPQYEVFRGMWHPATFLNFNNDGLADAFCEDRHLVLNMHGISVAPESRRALNWDSLVDSRQWFHRIPAPTVPGLLLPQAEPEVIITTAPYRAARIRVMQAKRIALIGYSFGGMDDLVAYRMLTQTVARTHAPVIAVGPDVTALTLQLQDDIKFGRVEELTAYWWALAEAIIATSMRRFHKSCDLRRRCARCVGYAYEGILDHS